MELLLDPNARIAFAMLTALEIVLGIDNIIFISVLVGCLPAEQRDRARRLGLGFAMVSRLLLLLSLTWVMGLTAEALDIHLPKGYIYVAMAFALAVEALNIRARNKRSRPTQRRDR